MKSKYLHPALFLLILMAPMHSAYCQQQILGIDKHFRRLAFDSLHVYGANPEWKHSAPVVQLHLEKESAESQEYYCLGKFSFDPSARYRGYLLGDIRQQRIHLYICDLKADSTLLELEVYRFREIPHTMQSLKNAWILDRDQDGALDILIQEQVEDYEFDLEGAPNISGTKRYGYRWVDGKLEYFEWTEDQGSWPLKR